MEEHFQKVCRFGWLCCNCQKYTYKSRILPTIQFIKESHICGIKLCHFCGDALSSLHQCQFHVPQPPAFLTKLGFLDIQLKGASPLSCARCFHLAEISAETVCEFCKDNKEIEPNICTILYETKREYFSQKVFTEFDTVSNEPEQESFTIQYLKESCHSLPFKQKTSFNKVRKNRLDKNTFIKEKMGVLEQMFDFLLKNEILHTTFLIHDDENKGILNEILKVLLRSGVIPNIVGTPHLRLIEIKDMGIRFLNSIAYVEQSHCLFFQKEKENPSFFPQKWNKNALYTYIGKPPTLDDLFHAEDTVSTITEKSLYITKLAGTAHWNFQTEIIRHSQKRVKIVAKFFLHFIADAFECQDFLFHFLAPNVRVRNYIMPFNPPLFTRASYAFSLLLQFAQIGSLKTEAPPVQINSSKQELEFCGFLRWKHPEYTFIDAWSPNGQSKFLESFPDSLCLETKTAHYFNGCLIHGHKKNLCLFKRKSNSKVNYFNVPLDKALENYEAKCEKLLLNHPTKVKNIQTMWDVNGAKKKKNKDVVKFLTSFYKEPPLNRLNCKFAVRGGITEVYACQWSAENISEKFYVADLISSYPFCARFELPTGQYKVITNK